MRHFNRVLEYILAEARAEMETPQKRGKLRVKPDDTGLICRRFAFLLHYFRHLGACFLHRLFYLGWLNATIGDELFERNLRDGAAQGVKKRRVLFVRRVINKDIDAGDALKCFNITTFFTDYFPFHII